MRGVCGGVVIGKWLVVVAVGIGVTWIVVVIAVVEDGVEEVGIW